MNKWFGSVLIFFILLGLLLSGCAADSAPIETPAVPSATSSLVPPTATSAPTLTPTPTAAPTATVPPTPTALPGVELFSLDGVSSSKPWLPFDENRAAVVHAIFFNTQVLPFNNALVRQAFAASIERQVIVEMAENWQAIDPSPATTFIPAAILGRDLFGVVGINFDPDRAGDLLAQAGYPDGSGFPEVTLIVNYYGDTAPGARFNMAREIAEMWHTYLGVTVNVETMQPPGFGDRLRSDPPELYWNGWVDSDPGVIDIFHSDSEVNFGAFSNPEIDSLIDQAGSSRDPAERQALYIQIERILCEYEAGVIPLYHTFSGNP